MLTESTGATKPVAVIIVGADALLAARPSTPIQLWHACAASGYDLAVPATWGDELVAAECLRTLGGHPEAVAVMCSCPMVARTVANMPFDLSGHLVATVAPPVAAAKYLRRVYGERRVHVTYAGACPAAADSAIDAWITPAELLERFRETGIVLEEQPELFESTLPPDRRRHLSQPGGLPAENHVASMSRPRRLDQLDDADLVASIERHLSTGVRTLVDLAPRVGCACSGALENVAPADARVAVTMLEPPRSSRPVMADPGGLGLSRRLPVRTPVPAVEPAARTRTPVIPPSLPKPERERPAAVATRATLSPLSWHLRERAHPQPPTTARAEQRRASEPMRATGASSAAWVSAASAERETSSPQAADAVTAAAVRALEQAAALRSSGPVRERDETGATEPAMVQGSGGREETREETREVRREGAGEGTREGAGGGTREGTREETRDAGGSSSEPRTQRATPPGGYWFAPPVVAGGSDTEVRRPSTPLDAVPDDVAVRDVAAESTRESRPMEQVEREAAPPVDVVAEAGASEALPTESAVSDALPTEAHGAGQGSATSEQATPRGGDEPRGGSLGVTDPVALGELAPAAAAPAAVAAGQEAEGDSPGAEAPDDALQLAAESEPIAAEESKAETQPAPEPAVDIVDPSGGRAEPEAPPPNDSAPDDVRAELAELFGLNEASASAANGNGSASESPANDVTPEVTEPAAEPILFTHVTPGPAPRRHADAPGPLPWKWLLGAALLIVIAVAISRQINARVTTEESGASALTGGVGAASGLLPAGALPARQGVTAETDTAADRVAPQPTMPTRPRVRSNRAAVQRAATAAGESTVVRAPARSSDSAGHAVPVRDSATRDATRVIPPPVRPDSLVPPLTARELELQAIRDELARRTARLDSMGRALGSLYVAPRRPPVPPPMRDPR